MSHIYYTFYLSLTSTHRLVVAGLFLRKRRKNAQRGLPVGKPEAHFFAISKETKKWQKTTP
jgi:hypothetical protein